MVREDWLVSISFEQYLSVEVAGSRKMVYMFMHIRRAAQVDRWQPQLD
jgi:hypothetical protein